MELFFGLPLVFTLVSNIVGEAAEVAKELDKLTTTESGRQWCPALKIGVECPQSSVFHFYRCCGDTLVSCCLQLQVWVVVVLIALGVVLLSSLLLLLIRCIFCRRS